MIEPEPLTEEQARLVKMIGDRMEEIGLRRDFAFRCGAATNLFVDKGYVMVHVAGKKLAPIYPPERLWSVVLGDLGMGSPWTFIKE